MPDRTSSPVGPPPASPTVPGVDDLQIIGRGGFGVVYRGHQGDLGRDVAVKVLSAPGADERAVELWRREVTAMGRLSNHSNIVAAFSAGVTADGHPYLVMPYVPGGSLHDRIRDHGPLPAAEVARIGARVASGLAAAHAARVLHRDVKPANVLMSEYGEPQLTDFGIARLVDAATTTTGSVRATIGYAAPEVLGGDPATPASDVYGLGATLHAALRGQAPFAGTEGESFAARIGRVMTQPPPDLRPLGVAPALAEVVEAALAKDPADRPQTANDLRLRLEALHPAALAVAAPPVDELTEPVAVAPAPPQAPDPEPALDPAPAPISAPGEAEDADRRSLVLVGTLVAVAVILLAGVVVWALTRGGDDAPEVATGSSTTATSSTTTTEAPSSTTTTTTTTEPATSPPSSIDEPTTTTEAPTTTTEAPVTTEAGGAPSADQLRAAVTDYYDLVDDGDLEAGYDRLSPAYQDRQPFAGYTEFWDQFRSVEVLGRPDVDADARAVAAQLLFVRSRGGSSQERVRITFVPADDGTLLIDTYEPNAG